MLPFQGAARRSLPPPRHTAMVPFSRCLREWGGVEGGRGLLVNSCELSGARSKGAGRAVRLVRTFIWAGSGGQVIGEGGRWIHPGRGWVFPGMGENFERARSRFKRGW